MSRVSLCIGVNKPGLPLAPLKASASGAEEFSNWLETKQSFDEVVCLTDGKAGSSVSGADVAAAVKTLVDRGPTQIVVYFSGHGILNGQSEIWLLSQAFEKAGQAVDLTTSRELARFCRVPNIVFISDACRALPNSLPTSFLTGVSIFPIPRTMPESEGETDVFYAAPRVGVALEVPTDPSKKVYKNLFTDLLMRCYKDPPPGLTLSLPADGTTTPLIVVPNRRLRPVLVQRVLGEAEKLFPGRAPSPVLRLESGDTSYVGVAEFSSDESIKVAPTPDPGPPPEPPQPRLPERMQLDLKEASFKAVYDTVRAFDDETGGFETRSGIELQGAELEHAVSTAGMIRPSSPGPRGLRRWHLDIASGAPPPTIGISFKGGGTVVTCLPAFVTAITVTDGRVANVSFIPARNGHLWQRYERRAEAVNSLRARVAAVAQYGRLTLEPEDVHGFAAAIRQEKNLDPTLGLYAAYAYAEIGNRREVQSVRDWMLSDNHVDLYDIALLAARKDPAKSPAEPIAPFCPMLSQGWSYAAAYGVKWPAPLARARRLPCLWTTFDTESTLRILQAIETGELR